MNDAHGRHDHEHHGVAELTSQTPLEMRLVTHARGLGWLTPAEIRGQVFTTVRLREGYEMGEVDVFLDKVEATLAAVLADNQDLRGRLSLAERAAAHVAQPPGADAGRIVALAQHAADQAITAAQDEAAAIVARARERAEAVVQQALDQGTQMRETLRAQARQLQSLVREMDTPDGALPAPFPARPGMVAATAPGGHPVPDPVVSARVAPDAANGRTLAPDATDRRDHDR